MAGDAGTTPVAAAPRTASVDRAPVGMTLAPEARLGRSVNQARGPAVQRRPSETLRNARTTAGSNCDPAQATSSFLAVSGGSAFL